MTLRVIIVDDEPLARDRLRRLLSGESDVEVVAECADGSAAVAAVRDHAPDVLFLDVQMPEMDGFEVLAALDREKFPAVVFVTAFDSHAVRAFEARALDYLLKPTTQKRLHEALERVRERQSSSAGGALAEQLRDLLAERDLSAQRVRRIAVRTGDRTIFVLTDDIDWVEAAGNYAILHVRKENHIVRETMSAMEAQLAPAGFLRVGRSAIVNLRRVKELQSHAPNDHVALLHDGQRVPVTRSLKEVEERLRFA